MRHALYLPPFGTFGDVHVVIDLAERAEAAGWDGLFLWDHLLYADPVPFVDPWVALAAVATRTTDLRIGPLVTPLPRRRPWKVAREAVTLDHLSRGRLTLGVGLGIDFWGEYSSFAGEVDHDRERADLVDDGVDLLRAFWSGQPVNFRGRRLAVESPPFLPRPLQPNGIPIWSAVLWPPKPGPLRRAAGVDGVVPFRPDGPMRPEHVHELRDRIRPSKPFDICLHGPPDQADAFAEAGVTWFMLSFLPDEPLAEVLALVSDGPPR